ncbi:MAG: trimethylamine methyltransferase family protein [Pseudomonadota bacterium]|nr:trimethylamine methyltransferase family protein [Pseudomonadota bacterium]
MSPVAVYAPTSARRGRQARQAARRAPPPPAPAYLTRRLPLYQMHGDEALALLETNADRILAEIGIDLIDDEALALWRAAGATVEGQRVRMPPGLCRDLIAGAIGHMPLVVMSRAALGHNGLPLKADALLSAAIACVFVGAVLRVTANFTGAAAGPVLMIAASLWSLALLLFFSRILPLRWRRMLAHLAGDG